MNSAEWITQATRKLQRAGINTARLDSLVLLEDCLRVDRARILGHPELELSIEQLNTLDIQITRRLAHEPLAYIRGHTEFYGRQFNVDRHVLVPRPETEMIIDTLLSLELASGSHLVDVGTGSGAIAITAKLELPSLSVTAIDVDPTCLVVARNNADKFGADISFIQGDLVEPIHTMTLGSYSLLCNLPYVPDEYSINLAAGHEPRLALFSGVDGLNHYRKMFKQLGTVSQKPAYIICESFPHQHNELVRLAQNSGYAMTSSADFIQVYKLTI